MKKQFLTEKKPFKVEYTSTLKMQKRTDFLTQEFKYIYSQINIYMYIRSNKKRIHKSESCDVSDLFKKYIDSIKNKLV